MSEEIWIQPVGTLELPPCDDCKPGTLCAACQMLVDAYAAELDADVATIRWEPS